METKTAKCSNCRETKPVSEFYRSASRSTGVSSCCKPCNNAASYQARKARLKDPEYAKQQKAKNQAWHENNKERMVHYRQFHYQANQEAIKQKVKTYRELNPEKAKQSSRLWQIRNPHKVVANYHKREAQKRSNGGSYTEQQWLDLCAACDYRCLACGEKKVLTVDHVLPIAKGGTSNIDNLQPLCLSCNCRKQDKHIDYR